MLSDPSSQAYQKLSAKYRVPIRVIENIDEMIRTNTGENSFFDIPELGGVGMWNPDTGAHIGNGFNRGLNNRATELFNEVKALSEGVQHQHDETTILTNLDDTQGLMPASITPSSTTWWSERYGKTATVSGNAGGLRFAYFKEHDRLIVQNNLRNRIFDTTGYEVRDVIAGKRTGFFNTIIKTTEEHLPITRFREVAR